MQMMKIVCAANYAIIVYVIVAQRRPFMEDRHPLNPAIAAIINSSMTSIGLKRTIVAFSWRRCTSFMLIHAQNSLSLPKISPLVGGCGEDRLISRGDKGSNGLIFGQKTEDEQAT